MTNSRRVADVVLKYSVDQAGASAAQQANKRLQAEMQSLATRQADVNREFRTAGSEAQAYNRNLQVLETNARQTAQSLDDLARPREIDVRTQRFDDVSRDVGLAGDVQSNLGAIGGLTGAAGLGGAGQGIAVGGELVALIEELPRLKTAVQGLPATVQQAGAALGGTGAGLIGALGVTAVAIGAVALAARTSSRQIQEAADGFRRAFDAQRELNRLIAEGASADEAREALRAAQVDQKELELNIQDLQRATGTLREAFEITTNSLPPFAQGFLAIPIAIGKVITKLDFFNKSLLDFDIPFFDGDPGQLAKEYSNELDAANKRVAAISGALDEGKFATTATANAFSTLTTNLNAGASTANQRAVAETKLAGAMRDGAKAAASVSDEFQRQRRESGQANAGRGVFNRNRARRRAQERERTQATTGGRSGGPSISQQIADAERNAAQQRFEQARQFNRDIERITLETQRRLTDIRTQAAFDERKAARGRDFAGIIGIRENAAQQAQQATLAAQRQADDRRIALDQQLADLNRANSQQLAALRAKQQAEGQILQQGYSNALGAARAFVRDLRNEFMQNQQAGVQAAVRREMVRITGGA